MQKYQSNRWYDKDPTVSLAISFLRNANTSLQEDASLFIINKSKELGAISNSKRRPFKIFNRRWYDSSEKLYNAIETLREAREDIQKSIAVELIDFLCTNEAKTCKDLV